MLNSKLTNHNPPCCCLSLLINVERVSQWLYLTPGLVVGYFTVWRPSAPAGWALFTPEPSEMKCVCVAMRSRLLRVKLPELHASAPHASLRPICAEFQVNQLGAQGHTRSTPEELQRPSDLLTPCDTPPGAGGCCTLFSLLPPIPRGVTEDGWTENLFCHVFRHLPLPFAFFTVHRMMCLPLVFL